MSTPLAELGLPARVHNRLAREGVETVSDLRRLLTRDELMGEAPIWCLRGIGWKSIEACMAAVGDHDRALRAERVRVAHTHN